MSRTTHPFRTPALAGRWGWRPVVMTVAALLMAFSLAGIVTSNSASAAVVSVQQCDGQGPGPAGATTVMNCDITVVNTINGGLRSSVVTVSRTCALGQCTGSSSSSYSDVVTSVNQCNGSDNDAAHPINCNVNITNFISADTPGAQPVTAATVNQCVGSGSIGCTPFPATTTNATVTQCNGSGTGGGGRVDCTVPGSTISPAIPIQVNQCNGSGNPGGSVVTCSASITTTITAAVVTPTTPPTSAPATGTPSGTPTGRPTPPASTGPGGTGVPTAPGTLVTPTPSTPGGVVGSPTPTTPGTLVGAPIPTSPGTLASTPAPQVPLVPTGGVQTGGGSTAGFQHTGLLALGSVLWLAAGCSALYRRRTSRRS